MNCNYCGFEMQDGATVCPNCGEEKGKVQILTPEERENFQGLTITEEPEPNDDGYYEYRSPDGRSRVYVRQVNVGKSPAGLLITLFVGAVILGLVIIALPLALLGLGIFILSWLLSGFRRS